MTQRIAKYLMCFFVYHILFLLFLFKYIFLEKIYTQNIGRNFSFTFTSGYGGL